MAPSRRSQRLKDNCHQAEDIKDASNSNTVTYERFLPRDSRKNHSVVSFNARKRPFHKGVSTCYEINVGNSDQVSSQLNPSKMKVTMCAKCINYLNEKWLSKTLRNAKDQFDENVGVRYQCDSLWTEKRCESLQNDSPPKKKVKPSSYVTPTPVADVPQVPPPATCMSSEVPLAQCAVPEFAPSLCTNKKDSTPLQKLGSTAPMENIDLSEQYGKLQQLILKVLAKHQAEELTAAGKATLNIIQAAEAKHSSSMEELRRIHLSTVEMLKSVHAKDLARHDAHCKTEAKVELQRTVEELNSVHLASEENLRREHSNYLERKQLETSTQLLEISEKHAEETSKLTNIINSLQDLLQGKADEVEQWKIVNDELQGTINRCYIEAPPSEKGLSGAIEELLEKTFSGRRVRQSTKVKCLVDATCKEVYGGECFSEVLKSTLPLIRENNPYRNSAEILRVLDVEGCHMNLSALDTLRKGIEAPDGVKGKRGENWLATTYSIKKQMKLLEDAAQNIIPYKMLDDSEGIDGIAFEMLPLFLYILDMFSLLEIARDVTKPPVEAALTLDGSDVSRNCSHVTGGAKMVDPRAIDPQSGLPIGVVGSRKIQSRELCFVFKTILSRDTKALYEDHFADFFAFFKDIAENGIPSAGIGPGRIRISSPQDMSSFWKSLKKGGACKQSKLFCHCCSCSSDDCCNPRPERCPKCVANSRELCYHHEVGDEATIQRLQEELAQLKETHGFLFDTTVHEKLKLRLNQEESNKHRIWSNIEFQPETNADTVRFGTVFLNHDLQLLGLPRSGNIEERRNRLWTALEVIERSKRMQRAVDAGDYSGAHILIEQAIPCILHCENRCGEKMVKMVLVEGLKQCGGNTGLEAEFLRNVEETVNTRILGHPRRRANWRLSTQKGSDNKKLIADQTMPNTHVRKFIENFDFLLDLCVEDDVRREQWGNTVELWMILMEKARDKEDFSDDDIDEFQTMCDDFFEGWVELHGRSGITNYFHMVGAGHLSYYLRVWRNLYRYSQQGWESLNAQIKLYYFNRTQRGGHGGVKDERNSKVRPIARWLQRKLLFLSGDYRKILG